MWILNNSRDGSRQNKQVLLQCASNSRYYPVGRIGLDFVSFVIMMTSHVNLFELKEGNIR